MTQSSRERQGAKRLWSKIPGWLKMVAAFLGIGAAIIALSVGAAIPLECWFGGGMAGWVQAVGTILAILAVIGTAYYQAWSNLRFADREREGAGQAAIMLAEEALKLVSDRLNAALTPDKPTTQHALRGNRTTEMVKAMREFDTARLPTRMLGNFITLRSHIFAVNERISELYILEEKARGPKKAALKIKRPNELESAIRVREQAKELFDRLGAALTQEVPFISGAKID